mgnify:CR=1 FL=1
MTPDKNQRLNLGNFEMPFTPQTKLQSRKLCQNISHVFFINVTIKTRYTVLERLNSANYMSRPAWTLLHKLQPYLKAPSMTNLSVAEHIGGSLINLPSSPKLTLNS